MKSDLTGMERRLLRALASCGKFIMRGDYVHPERRAAMVRIIDEACVESIGREHEDVETFLGD